jgi:hypothetical protein
MVVSALADEGQAEKLYYAIEQDETICGYAEVTIFNVDIDGREVLQLEDVIKLQISALGAPVETNLHFVYHIDPLTGKFFYHTSDIEQATVKMGATFRIENDTAFITSEPDARVEKVALPAEVVLENPIIFGHLIEDFADNNLDEKTYQVFDVVDGIVHDMTYSKLGDEPIELNGNSYDAVVVKQLNHASGIKSRLWINKENHYLLRAELPGRTLYLAEESVKDKITTASIDDDLFARVGVVIDDIKGISYMKVRGIMEPGGVWLTPGDLNVPGQRFDGTVKENLIEGIFEISHEKYDGTGAPPFPTDYTGDEDLKKYIEPEEMIESDDEILVNKAQALTEGSVDSWEAFTRLSKWVADEIGYDIPGGGTAKNTYETRVAECGGHSRLVTAFSRAAGIPCRVVWGCMYVPDQGGAFGQHAWNEVYMGEAGWIPVDATAQEYDYVDCGHIRIAEAASRRVFFNPTEMELLDYHVGDITMADAGRATDDGRYQAYVGDYSGENEVLKISVQNNSLALQIPGKPTFELNDPDENGVWFFKLTNAASVSFETDDAGMATAMSVRSGNKLSKKAADSAEIYDDVPDEYRRYLGKYALPMGQGEFAMVYRDGNLALIDPGQSVMKLEGSAAEGKWTYKVTEVTTIELTFDLRETGEVAAMVLTELSRFPRTE